MVDGVCDHLVLVRALGPSTAPTLGPATPAADEELILDRLIHEPGRLAILTVLSSVPTRTSSSCSARPG